MTKMVLFYIITGAVGEKRYPFVDNPSFNFEYVNNTFNSVYLSIDATPTLFDITVFEATDGSIVDSYTKTKEVDYNDYDYYLIDDRLISYENHYSRPVDNYTGFVKNLDNSLMYFINGKLYKGLLTLGSNTYFLMR